MLETTRWLLFPWQVAGTPASSQRGWFRTIAEADSGKPLGRAYWRPSRLPRWLVWLGQPELVVVETEDESHLCTLRWSWSRGWQLWDAEERYVGIIRPSHLRDPYGYCLAWLQRGTGSRLRIQTPEGQILAAAIPSGKGLEVSLAERVAADPFTKMLLLAAVLVEARTPVG
ncbi:MAG: hypothetical protein ACK4RK_21185 [Gemmataceae bacterium]